MAEKTMDVGGAYAPIPTPLDRDGALDLDALASHLRWLEEEGLDGALVLGSNGEFPSFSLEERRRVAEAAASAGTALRLILNVGSCSLPESEVLLRCAHEVGFAAVLCPPPFYFKTPPQRGVAEFLERILDLSDLPVLLYHIPQVTGVPISDELLDFVGDHPRLAGVKDSTGEENEMRRLLARFTGRSYLVGSDRLASACLASGGAGTITAAANVVPALVKSIASHPQEQVRLTEVRAVMEKYGLIPAAKALLADRGLGSYRSRPPMVDLEAGEREELLRAFAAVESSP